MERTDLAAQLRPTPPIRAGRVAADAGATAMMDVSDGLVLDLTRMATASSVTIDLDKARVAADAPARFALTGGEDHALVCTFPSHEVVPRGFRVIGSVRERDTHPVFVNGEPFLDNGGWDPYRDWDRARD